MPAFYLRAPRHLVARRSAAFAPKTRAHFPLPTSPDGEAHDTASFWHARRAARYANLADRYADRAKAEAKAGHIGRCKRAADVVQECQYRANEVGELCNATGEGFRVERYVEFVVGASARACTAYRTLAAARGPSRSARREARRHG